MFTAALCTIAGKQKQPRCPLADGRIRKLRYVYIMEYYSAIKRNAFESVLTDRETWCATVHGVTKSQTQLSKWTELTGVDEPRGYYTQWSKSERERQISYINAYISTDDPTCRAVDITDFWTQKREWDDLREQHWNTQLPQVKETASGNLLYDAGNPKLLLCDNLERWDGEGRGREGIYICLWLIHAAVWQKPPQYYKEIIL